ncbi:MAG: DNA alkylation repair protein [Ruminiclostridium sp.]|nr:DNA alkylation repair protein [Ruminiclostridium sp.]
MNALTKQLRAELKAAASDEKYREMQTRIIPTVPADSIIGVRVPDIRQLAAAHRGEDVTGFLGELPHKYMEENYLHAFFVAAIRDFDECMSRTEEFLPYIDNWAVCDSFAPKVFGKHRQELLAKIPEWHNSGHTYMIRFGTGCLMRWFLDEGFEPRFLDMAASVRSDEYYVNMMTAWFFATALAKQYESSLPYISEHRLDKWTHNKAIQKALESYRVPDDHKSELRALKY